MTSCMSLLEFAVLVFVAFVVRDLAAWSFRMLRRSRGES